MHFLFISCRNHMKCWYKCPLSLSFEVSFTFTTALYVTWLTDFLPQPSTQKILHIYYNIPCDMADTFSPQTSTRKILYIYYNITCDMADTFSAQTSIQKILYIYYNITCDMADIFSAFFKYS